MQPPDDIGTVHDASSRDEGPNSGGVTGWYLRDGHLFRYAYDGPGGSVDRGVPASEWLARWCDSQRPRIVAIVTDLEARGYS